MSSFLVSNETINRVLHLLDLDACCCPKGHVGDNGDELGQQLWQLNADAYACRYPSHETIELEPFAWSPRNYSLIEMLKAGICWRYQCSEGEQFEKHHLYTAVSEKVDAVAYRIVSDLPEYNQAAWDAPHNYRCVKAS